MNNCGLNIYNTETDNQSITLNQIGDNEPTSERILVDQGNNNYGIRGIIAGDLIYTDIDGNGNIEIGVTGLQDITGTNLGTGEQVYVTGSAPDFEFKTISSGGLNTFVTSTPTEVQISTTPVNSVGTGNSIVANAFNQVKSLVSGSNITITDDGNTLTLASTNFSAQSVGAVGGFNVYIPGTTPNFQFARLIQGNNITMTQDASGITINSSGLNEVGTGFSIVSDAATNTLRSLIAGSNITITENVDDIEISASGGGNLTLDNTSASIADGVQVTSSAMPISSGTANFRRMLGGKNIITTQLVNSIRFDVDPAQRTNSFSVFRSSSVPIGAAYANIVFNSAAFPGYREVTSTYSTGTGAYTVPITGGYQFSYNLIIDSSLAGSGLVEAKLNVTGSPFDVSYTNITIAGANLYSLNASTYIYCNTGNAVSVQIRYTGPGSVFVNAGSGFSCWRQY